MRQVEADYLLQMCLIVDLVPQLLITIIQLEEDISLQMREQVLPEVHLYIIATFLGLLVTELTTAHIERTLLATLSQEVVVLEVDLDHPLLL